MYCILLILRSIISHDLSAREHQTWLKNDSDVSKVFKLCMELLSLVWTGLNNTGLTPQSRGSWSSSLLKPSDMPETRHRRKTRKKFCHYRASVVPQSFIEEHFWKCCNLMVNLLFKSSSCTPFLQHLLQIFALSSQLLPAWSLHKNRFITGNNELSCWFEMLLLLKM